MLAAEVNSQADYTWPGCATSSEAGGIGKPHRGRFGGAGRTRSRPHVQLTPAGVVNPRIMDLSLTPRARRSFLEPGVLSVNGRRVECRAEWPIFGHSLSLSC